MARQLEYPLISCNSLMHLLSRNPQTVLLCIADCRLGSPIPGSIHIQKSLLSDSDEFFARIPGIEHFDESQVIVCYEYEGLEHAATAWWHLVFKGCRYVSVLEGGLKRWHEKASPEFGAQIAEAMSPRLMARGDFRVLVSTEPCLRTQLVTTDPSEGPQRLYINTALLLKGADLFEPKILRCLLVQAGLKLDQDCETVAFGPQAPLLLLILCSLGKRRIRQGMEIVEDLALYSEEDINQHQRKVSNLNVSEPVNSTRASLVMSVMAESVPNPSMRDGTIMLPRAKKLKRVDCRSEQACRCDIF